MGIWLQPFTVILWCRRGPKIGNLGVRQSSNDIAVSWLRPWSTAKWIPHPYWGVYEMIEHIHMLWIDIWVYPYTVILWCRRGANLENGDKAEPKWHWSIMVEAVIHQWLHPTSIWCMKSDWTYLYAVDGHMHAPLHCYCVQVGTKFRKIEGKVEPKQHCGVMLVELRL